MKVSSVNHLSPSKHQKWIFIEGTLSFKKTRYSEKLSNNGKYNKKDTNREEKSVTGFKEAEKMNSVKREKKKGKLTQRERVKGSPSLAS